MRYEFPQDITLAEVSDVVARHNAKLGVNAFIMADRGDYVIFNYLISFPETFPNANTGDPVLDREAAILRECRGLTFHKNGRIVARKYSKFFNVGQKEETQIGNIDWAFPHHVLEKLDGSMITPVYVGDDIEQISPEALEWHTKMGNTDVAQPVYAWIEKHPTYARWAATVIYAGYTPIFEWCSRKQRIVIDYPVDRLVLTGVRNNKTGEYHSYEDICKVLDHGIEPVRALPGSIENIETFMSETRDLKGEEGYVIRFHDGHMVKVKAEEYCQIHGTKDSLQHEKDVVSLIAHDRLDDVIPFMDPDDKDRVERFQAAYEAAVEATAANLEAVVRNLQETAGSDPKTFAMAVKASGQPSEYMGVIFRINKGASASAEIRGLIAQAAHPTAGTQTRINTIRHMMGGLRWDDYRDHNYSDED
jgi:T4 RnlA family RNA ligase